MKLTKEKAKENLIKLVEKFKKELDAGKIEHYNEEDTKMAFISPLLKDVLGWDVNDRDEVSYEVRTSRGRVDYGLKADGKTKVFVEAKSPKADLTAEGPVTQAIKYGYSHRDVPFVLLIDFEEFRLFDVTIKPNPRNLKKGLKIDITWDQYVEKFDKLWLLSKESALNGDLEKLLGAKAKDKQPVDKEILEDLKKWREALAKDIYKRNHKLFNSADTEKDAAYLKEITQKILDRIIFMRSCEDRNLTHRRKLRDVFAERSDDAGAIAMTLLREEFRQYNIVFDSDLFDPKQWEDEVDIDLGVMKTIIEETYEPYQFDVIPVEVLGFIYEQYLGYTIRLTEHQVKYELKPDVRKAGGVYYTPEYIVDYIVKNTVGKLLEELPATKAKKLRILDPACGSGSFLLRAYQEMLNYYKSQKPKAPKKAVEGQAELDIENEEGIGARLTIHEKSRILRDHIFGVDIDEQAVEVTKLSLMLKMLEGEFTVIHGKQILPALDKNIRCGNSLISGDTLELQKYFGNDWHKVKPFNWDQEFKEIMVDEGGFDAVIGNPPYGAEISSAEKKFFDVRFRLDNTDTACLFMGLVIRLLRKAGLNGFIVPKPFTYSSKWQKIRQTFCKEISEIVDCKKVWSEVKLEQVIYFLQKGKTKSICRSSVREGKKIRHLGDVDKAMFDKFEFYVNGLSPQEINVGVKIKDNSISFSEICNIVRGQDIQDLLVGNNYDKGVFRCKSICRYFLREAVEGITSTDYKRIKNDISYMEKPKIVVQNIVAHVENPVDHIILMATIDNQGIISLGSVGNMFLKQKNYDNAFLLGILNSQLISWYVYRFIYGKAIRTMRFDNYHLERVPFPVIDINGKNGKNLYDNLVNLVNAILDLNKSIQAAKGNVRDRLEEQIKKTDREIDDLVYKLYGITDEERKIIEGEKNV